MRTFKTSLMLVAFFLLLAPAPAQAWWGWLDEMSGPGPWMFTDLQFRIICIEDKSSDAMSVQNTNSKDQRPNVLRSLNSFEGFRKVAGGCVVGGGGFFFLI